MAIKIITENRKARFNYEILEHFEAGFVLQGSEVKSLRNGKANLGDAYASIKNGEIYLHHAHISPYQVTHYADHNPLRERKLLLHSQEIRKLIGKVQIKGLTLVPLKMYFKDGRAKVELALAKGKNVVDKRETIKRRDEDRNMRKAIKQGRGS